MAPQIAKLSTMNYSFNTKSTTPSTHSEHPDPDDYKTLQEWFTRTFEDLAATATVYTASAPPTPHLPRPPTAQILEVADAPRVGDIVWNLTKRQTPDRTTKGTHHWTGIFRIVEVLKDGQIKIDKIQQPGNPVMTTIQNIHQYLPTETRMTRPLRPDVAPPAPPSKPDQTRLQQQ